MTKNIYISICVILTGSYGFGQNMAPFPGLKKITIDTVGAPCIFGYDTKGVIFINTGCDQLPKTDYWHCDSESFSIVPIIKLAKFSNEKISDTLFILFDHGLSADPEYTISKRNGKIVGRISCLEFYIHSNGVIYTAGHINNMFNKRQKFQLSQDTITEIRQPSYYVGLKSKTTVALTLYTTKTKGGVVAQLPKDYEVEILLCEPGKDGEERIFLVKTEFGLVGWLVLPENSPYDTPIEGLFNNGD